MPQAQSLDELTAKKALDYAHRIKAAAAMGGNEEKARIESLSRFSKDRVHQLRPRPMYRHESQEDDAHRKAYRRLVRLVLARRKPYSSYSIAARGASLP